MLARLAQVKPFVLVETHVPAAGVSQQAQAAIERFLLIGRRDLWRSVTGYLGWLHGPQGAAASPAEAQRQFTFCLLYTSPSPRDS